MPCRLGEVGVGAGQGFGEGLQPAVVFGEVGVAATQTVAMAVDNNKRCGEDQGQESHYGEIGQSTALHGGHAVLSFL